VADQALNVQPVIDWLADGAPPSRLAHHVMHETCRRMVAAGLPLYRVGIYVRTLHPNVLGRGFVWQADRDTVEVNEAAHDLLESEAFLKSPIRLVFFDRVEVRRRLCDPGSPMDFPILHELRQEGATDFLAAPLRFIDGEVHAATFATRRAGGFSDAQVEALHRVLPPFTRLVEVHGNMRKARNILDAYLGPSAGEKVLAGQIKRGDGADIEAVIWFCDLRDSTPLANSMSRQAFLGVLNEYFECVLGPVQERGGEILRFIGDAALAIFPIGSQPPAVACGKALDAARESISRMQALNAKRASPLRFGIGLHLGPVLYGNIGTPSRIEFTVIGAAANEAARIEALCKTLRVDLLVSAPVARELREAWKPLGRHALRGVGNEIELFTLPFNP
jgi:adenylate cyclase